MILQRAILFLFSILAAACNLISDPGPGNKQTQSAGPGNGAGLSIELPDGMRTYTHQEVVSLFRGTLKLPLTLDQNSYFTVAKSSTEKYNYFILKTYKDGARQYDFDYHTCTFSEYDCLSLYSTLPQVNIRYYAINLTDWIPNLSGAEGGVSSNDFLTKPGVYEEVKDIGNNTFQSASGIVFQTTSAMPKNLSRMKALQEEATVRIGADDLILKYGLSQDKALDLARFSFRLRKKPPGTYRTSDFDSFAKEFVGSSITDFQTDFRERNALSLAQRIQKASQLTGISPEGMNAIIGEVFLGK